VVKQRMQGRLVFGWPLVAAIVVDLVGLACIVAGFVVTLEAQQRFAIWGVGGLLLLASACLLIWQLTKHGRRVPNHHWW
jgi:hypothetical protein